MATGGASSVLVIGSSGQLAQSLRQTTPARVKSSIMGRGQLDLRDAVALNRAIEQVRPDVVINAGGYTQVDMAESEPEEALRLNRDGPSELAEITQKRGILLVHFSTDSVYDGALDRPYVETDKANPLNVYGQSKLAGERAVLTNHADALIFRVSWLYSPWGRNFLWTMLSLAKTHDEIKVVGDQYGAPTSAIEVAKATWTAVEMRLSGRGRSGLFHMTGPDHTNRVGFAAAIFDASKHWRGGSVPKLISVSTDAFPTAAKRGLNARLDSQALYAAFGIELPTWQSGILETLEALKPEFGNS